MSKVEEIIKDDAQIVPVPAPATDPLVILKLDAILALLSTKQEREKDVKDKIKDEVIEYMLEHFNISWLDDDIEKNVYDEFFNILFALIGKYIPF